MSELRIKRWASFGDAASEYFGGDQDALIEYLLEESKLCWLRLGAANVLKVPVDAYQDGLRADANDQTSWERSTFTGYAMIWGAPVDRILARGSGKIEWICRKMDGIPQYMYLEPDTRGMSVSRDELWIGRRVVEKFLSDLRAVRTDAADEEPASRDLKPIRSDREQSLLRVVAALWKLSSLPLAPHTAADRVSAIIDGWGWDGPKKGTIADRILKEAAALPGSDLRKS